MRKAFFLIFSFAALPATAEFGPLFRPKNESPISYKAIENFTETRSHYTGIVEGTCSGKLKDSFLAESGISKGQLKKGVRCVAGDFDSNGFLDFALFGRRGKELVLGVLFFEKAVVIRRQLLTDLKLGTRSEEEAGVGLYPSGFQGEAGEPKAKADGLFRWGKKDDDERSHFAVWFYDPSKELMEKKLYPNQGD